MFCLFHTGDGEWIIDSDGHLDKSKTLAEAKDKVCDNLDPNDWPWIVIIDINAIYGVDAHVVTKKKAEIFG